MSDLFTIKRVIVQGITGSHGAFHTRRMLAYGTPIIGGTSPTKAGGQFEGLPVTKTVKELTEHAAIDCSVIFVPAPFAAGAILEAIEAEIPLIICITEHIPIHDMLKIKQRLVDSSSVLIGPNTPGILLPDQVLLGIIPSHLATAGHVAIVSRSGTLTYEAMDLLTKHGLGQSHIIGIGGDQLRGFGFVEALAAFEADDQVERIVMIGEIGGRDEHITADYIKQHVTKPVFAYVAGHAAPAGVQLGHAGAILGSTDESADAKTIALNRAGATTASSITALIKQLQTHQSA